MERSKLAPSLWVGALWLVLASSKGISSLKLADMLGVQQKTAWFLCHRIRAMMAWCICTPIGGEIVEVDEVYAGAPPRQRAGGGRSGLPSGRGPRRPLVLTAAIRGGDVRLAVIASHGRGAIEAATRTLLAGVRIFMTDALPAYRFLGPDHRTVTHSAKEFARTDPDGTAVHVNTVEAVHGELRRLVIGVHHRLGRKHLQRYLDDLGFRRSHRDAGVRERMRLVLQAPGRLSYQGVIAAASP
jgi:hypothetical protein